MRQTWAAGNQPWFRLPAIPALLWASLEALPQHHAQCCGNHHLILSKQPPSKQNKQQKQKQQLPFSSISPQNIILFWSNSLTQLVGEMRILFYCSVGGKVHQPQLWSSFLFNMTSVMGSDVSLGVVTLGNQWKHFHSRFGHVGKFTMNPYPVTHDNTGPWWEGGRCTLLCSDECVSSFQKLYSACFHLESGKKSPKNLLTERITSCLEFELKTSISLCLEPRLHGEHS